MENGKSDRTDIPTFQRKEYHLRKLENGKSTDIPYAISKRYSIVILSPPLDWNTAIMAPPFVIASGV